MTELELARYAYHNCELEAAMRYCEWARHAPAAAALRVKSLCELDRAVAARSEAEAALALFPDDGPLHYYTGMATYLAGGSREEISGAFEAALERGFAGGAMGLAFLAYAARDVDEALSLLERGRTADVELEHVRLLMGFQVELDAGRTDAAESLLAEADRLLKASPSLLRTLWGQLCWVRLLQAARCFEVGLVAANRLMEQLSPLRTPRLYRNASEVVERLRARDGASVIRIPEQEAPARPHLPLEINRKPMLNALYHYLGACGNAGATKEDIVARVWDQAYNPLVHDDRLYKAIGRLRRLLGDDAERPRVLYQRGSHYILEVDALCAPASTLQEVRP
jgi:tetratricopeptide (TPR) repeat protein